MRLLRFLVLPFLLLTACAERPLPADSAAAAAEPATAPINAPFALDFERYRLANGLTVILHVDRSDPVVAVALTAHVGSAREQTGRTGFAHLFEHLLFLESENLGKGGLDALSARIGGSGANGSTSRDRTNYFQTVPSDALEKMLWAEADKLGWFINTVTEPVLAKEKQVVKNEKRLRVDNVPYGHTFYAIDRNLYPQNHPYSWQVIGSLEDLQSAQLADVKSFFNAWYTPNNVTLAVAGDFDVDQARAWIEKYFGEIARGPDIELQPKQPAVLEEPRSVMWEDNFASLPRLTMTWPTVHRYHPDEHALDLLAQLLSDGKEALLNQVLVDELALAPEVAMFAYNSELAGAMNLFATGFDGVDLDALKAGVDTAFRRFAETGVSEQALARLKAGAEREYYEQFDSVLGKAFTLAQYQIFTGDPAFAAEDLRNLQAVTVEDVARVFETYLQGRPFVATSFVPKGQAALALEGARMADIREEAIVQDAEETFDAAQGADYERTPSRFDRSVEPPYGPAPVISTPAIWEAQLPNGVAVSGIEQRELPLVRFSLVVEGGQMLEDPARPGVVNLLASSMLKGTAQRTTAELENAIKALGADIEITAGQQSLRLDGTTLARHFEETMALLVEILREPRFDPVEFERLKRETAAQLKAQSSDPGAIANRAWARLIYGENSPLAANILGTEASLDAITLDDLENWHDTSLAPGLARLHVVGAIPRESALNTLHRMAADWVPFELALPEIHVPPPPEAPRLLFIDVPDAKQSVVRIGYPALARTAPAFYPATIANYRLGGGGFASRLTQELREGKGYTYGISSRFSGTDLRGPFTVSTNVRSNVTLESLQLIREILGNYGAEFDADDLAVTQNFLLKSQARAFETLGSKLGMLENISAYDWPHDYLQRRQATIRSMTVDEIRSLAAAYLDPGRMIYLVVGDAATQQERLEALGIGPPRPLEP